MVEYWGEKGLDWSSQSRSIRIVERKFGLFFFFLFLGVGGLIQPLSIACGTQHSVGKWRSALYIHFLI